jgi:hypothetical protein
VSKTLFEGNTRFLTDACRNNVIDVVSVWFTALVASLVAAGVMAQLGWPEWQLPTPKRGLPGLRKRKPTDT